MPPKSNFLPMMLDRGSYTPVNDRYATNYRLQIISSVSGVYAVLAL